MLRVAEQLCPQDVYVTVVRQEKSCADWPEWQVVFWGFTTTGRVESSEVVYAADLEDEKWWPKFLEACELTLRDLFELEGKPVPVKMLIAGNRKARRCNDRQRT